MNNRYLYRAKRTDNGEWIVGSLIRAPYLGSIRSWISSEQEDKARLREISSNQAVWRAFEVRTDTICQCTGLKDKSGNLIWENDIVKFEDCGEEGYEYKEGFDFTNRARVEFAEGRWSLTDFASDNSYVMSEMYDHAEFMELWKECEVIGSAIDNPELLE